MHLIMILLVLFISLFVVVQLAEKYGKPLSREKQAKYSRITIVLMVVLLVGQLIKEYLRS